jgi:hypothetical protein
VREAGSATLIVAGEGDLDRLGQRVRVVRIGSHRRGAGCLVERGMGRGYSRCAARECLDDRESEALEHRRIDESQGAAIEGRELVVFDIAQQPHALRYTGRVYARSETAGDDEQELVAPPPQALEGVDQRPKVLARLERRDCQNIGVLELSTRPFRAKARVDPRIGDVDPLGGEPSRLATSPAVKCELAKMTSQVATAFLYLAPCIRRVRGWTSRETGVAPDRGSSWWTASLRRVHPVREVEDVERADDSLDRQEA